MPSEATAKNGSMASAFAAAKKKAERLTETEMEIRSKNAMTEVFAETLLMGFGNLKFQGAALPPGKDSHLIFLRVKDFRELVVTKASEVEHYRLADKEAAAGN